MDELPISCIRRDGGTQHRAGIDPGTVDEYAELLAGGTVFPPVTVWFDGSDYWLTDGFHRLAAAEESGRSRIAATVRHGFLNEAQWDSYAANADHGVRRSRVETQRVMCLALHHPKAGRLSNVEIARHLHVPETTLRRWRKKISSPIGEDEIRVVTRGESTYKLRTTGIGQHDKMTPALKSAMVIRRELLEMKERSSQDVRRLLAIIENWVVGSGTGIDCLAAVEDIVLAVC